jgi:RHS repeat-associated protein
MYYDRDVQGRVIARYKDTITSGSWAAAGTTFYHFTGSGDEPDYVRDNSWMITEKNLSLPGGVSLTIKPTQTGNAGKQYSLPNIHSDTLLTTDASGANTSNGNGPASTFTYDPFGNILTGSNFPVNTAEGSYGWLGQHLKLTETNFALTPQVMGARIYLSGIGRFTQVDPVEGGCSNAYAYVYGNPIHNFDLTGTKTDCKSLADRINFLRDVVEQRYNEIVQNKNNLPMFGKISVKRHQQKYRSSQNTLKNRLKDWNNSDCNGKGGGRGLLDNDVKYWAKQGVPDPNTTPISISWKKIAIYSVVISVALTATYLIGGLAAAPAL